MGGETSPVTAKIGEDRMKQLNVWPLLILLIAVVFLVIWLKP
jgi:hypothetical protein